MRNLRAFLAVAESLSFTQAAVDLGTTQPSLTRSVRRLEEAMNVQLLNRTTRSVTLSEAGLRLRDELRELLPRMESALHPSCDHSVLRLGFTWLFPDGWTRRAIARFEEESGTCVVLVRRDDRFAGVDVGHAHVSLLRRQPTASGLRAVRLAEEARWRPSPTPRRWPGARACTGPNSPTTRWW
ncbi:LysR family transcriptional regulator [Streptomyces sp. M19]